MSTAVMPDFQNVTMESIENWSFFLSRKAFPFPKLACDQAIEYLQAWARLFPREETWVQRTHHVPSLIVRVEGVWRSDQLSLFEIEERPAGIGFCCKFNPSFRKSLWNVRKKWPKDIRWVQSNFRQSGDDQLWLGDPIDRSVESYNGPLLIRAEPEEIDFHRFEANSISSVKQKGNKSYGVPLGFWSEVTFADVERLPWSQGFVLKPLQGSKCHGVHVWVPCREQLHGIAGMATATKIRTVLEQSDKMYLQPLVWPMSCPENKQYFMMFRMFFGYDPSQSKYVPIGGMWNARSNFLLHGTSETVFGPLQL